MVRIMTKLQKNSILFWLGIAILILFTFMVTSCASRKVNKSETQTKESKEQVKIDSTKTTTNSESNIKVVDLSNSDEIVIEPKDNTKEMVVNGKRYKNAILKRKATKLNKVVTLENKVATIEQKAVKTVNKQSKENKTFTKNTERHSFNWWWLILLLIPIAYLKYKKYI